jgi:toxin FitB
MRYLLDTVVLSEYAQKKPNQVVINWLDEQDEQDLFISALTVAELKKGYYKLAQGDSVETIARAKNLRAWIQTVVDRFQGRTIAVDAELLDRWAKMSGTAEAAGRKLPIIDSLLAATAEHHHLIVVTRNVTDFQNCSSHTELHNPYDRLL